MTISVFDLFKIGIGPSSSHTVGPMKAAKEFATELANKNLLNQTKRITVELFGSLAFTGKGHGTDKAILLGLEGYAPHLIDPTFFFTRFESIVQENHLLLNQSTPINFNFLNDVIFNFKDLKPKHTNAMHFSAYDENQTKLFSSVYYSIGGGFIINDLEENQFQDQSSTNCPYPFSNAKELLALCEKHQLPIKDIVFANECYWQDETIVKKNILTIANTMRECIKRGCETKGILPGGLNVARRAPVLHEKLLSKGKPKSYEYMDSMEWLNLFAIAVNEENAAFGRVVTAPTNGAAGVIPAVLNYYLTFYPQAKEEDAIDFLLTASAIGILYKKGASISGAEVGCQGEVGVACSMAAAALTAILGGTLYQIENAAEIAMEHHLGLTCDPINGLVQIPCIERNAMGAVKAVNATRLALLGDGEHHVTLDKVIATMKQTGKDMMSIYKETSLGGLAANLPEC